MKEVGLKEDGGGGFVLAQGLRVPMTGIRGRMNSHQRLPITSKCDAWDKHQDLTYTMNPSASSPPPKRPRCRFLSHSHTPPSPASAPPASPPPSSPAANCP